AAPSPELFIAAADEAGRKWIFAHLMELRGQGIPVETDFLGRSLKSQMREADRQHARYVIVVGQNEVAAGMGTMKEMSTGKQSSGALGSIVPWLKKMMHDDSQ